MQKYKIIIGIVVVMLVGIFVYAAVVSFFTPADTPQQEQEIQQTQLDTNASPTAQEPKIIDASSFPKEAQVQEVTQEEQERENVVLMARNFIERYGSYSNTSNFENFSDLNRFMTNSMKVWVEGVKEQIRSQYADTFYGIMTKATSAQLTNFDIISNQSRVLVITQQTETMGDQTNSYVQSVRVELVKEEGVWKVSGVFYLDDKRAN